MIMKQTILSLLFTLLPIASAYSVKIDGIYYNLNKSENTAEVTNSGNYNSYSGDVFIPSEVIYKDVTYRVTSIGDHAFESSTNLTSVVIPEGVTIIGEDAFQGCNGLISIRIPEGVISIGALSFCNCISLSSVSLPNSLTSIGSSAFRASGLTSVIIPDNVISIEYFTFMECDNLTSVTIGNSVKFIGASAFEDCPNLTSVTFGKGLTSIEGSAFKKCKSLTSLTIPEGVISIDRYAFYGCSELISLTIPQSVASLGEDIIRGCSNLTDIYCHAEDIPNTDDLVFYHAKKENITLHVPENSVNKYKVTSPWNLFKDIVALPKCATPTITNSDGKVRINCETEDAEFVYEVKVTAEEPDVPGEVSLSNTYIINVYAKKAGFSNSDVASAEIKLGESGGLKGDVTGNGVVDIEDVTAVIDIIMQK